jgi:hypothetical protein
MFFFFFFLKKTLSNYEYFFQNLFIQLSRVYTKDYASYRREKKLFHVMNKLGRQQ